MGPLAHCVEDLAGVMRAWLRPSTWSRDTTLPHMVFNEDTYAGKQLGSSGGPRRLRIAYFVSDDWFDPCPTGVRAVEEAAASLQALGHEVVKVTLPDHINGWEAARLYVGIVGADGNMKAFLDALDGERLHEYYATMKTV